jgi:flagellar assembly protein FliH
METSGASAAQGGDGTAKKVVAFEYPARADAPGTPQWEGWGDSDAAGGAHAASSAAGSEAALRAEFESKLAEEARRAFEAGRERGRQEGRQAEREIHAAVDGERRRQTAATMEGFAQERDRYLHAVEHEVVELALAVAARILRREAQMDPLLLTGAVRVALGQLAATTKAKLRVPAEELKLWSDAMALLPNLPVKPEVLSGEGMRLGDCAIETELGSVDLGIRAQLGEIERGFFDRAVGAGARRAGTPVESGANAGTV